MLETEHSLNAIRRADTDDVSAILPLFIAYHHFYNVQSNADDCRRFLHERLMRNESIIFVAESNTKALGFTQLYPTFSSLAMKPSFVLYDLFVVEQARGQGIADQLMAAAEAFAQQQGAHEIMLQTAHTNVTAQALYEKRGYQRENAFYTYYKAIT